MKVRAVQITVRTGEVNVLHRTECFSLRFSVTVFAESVFVQYQQLARQNVSNRLGTNHFKCAGLRGEQIRISQLSHRQRTQSVRIAGNNQLVICHQEKSESPHQTLQCILRSLNEIFRRTCDKMGDNLSVTSSLKNRTALLKLAADLRCIDDIAVRGYRQISITIFKYQRLSVRQTAVSTSRVTNMTDRTVAAKRHQFIAIKNFLNESHTAVIVEFFAT
ncbi:hypothetical protein D3C73_1065840 [compost metagenome]